MSNYTVTVEQVVQPNCESSYRRVRFDIFCNTTAHDANNNLKEICVQKLASFELLERDIQSIRVTPVVPEKFNVEFIKCSKTPKPSKSTSVQFIHRRNGKFMDSNENFVPVLLYPITNRVPEGRLTKLSTFYVAKRNESNRKDGDLDNSEESSPIESLVITDTDFNNFSKFTFTFKPLIETNPIVNVEAESQTSIEESLPEAKTESVPVEVEEVQQDTNNNEELVVDNVPIDQPTEAPLVPDYPNPMEPSTSIPFSTVFDGTIELIIELKNIIFAEAKRRACLLANDSENNALLRDCSLEDQTGFQNDSSMFKNQVDGVLKSQVPKASPRDPNSGMKATVVLQSPNTNRMSKLRSFVKSMVVQRLQSLGVQQLDCNEILDSWEANQFNTNWYFSWPDESVGEPRIRNPGIMSPYVSRPNSSLFRLTPSGHISRSIFSTFVHQVDSLKNIVNNATCTLIQTSVHLLLPEIKLLCARQLETNNNPIFIQEWVRLILLAAKELKPFTPDHVAVMVNRELKALKNLSECLHKATKKICRKIGKLSGYSEAVFRKTLIRLHPKSLQWVSAFDRALKKCYAPDVIHYDPSKLHNIELKTGDLFKDHIFLSETSTGELLVKNDIDGFWDKFMDLEFCERRTIFLALTEDLQSALRRSLNEVHHLQEIYTEGYPGSIKRLLKDVVEELKITSKRDDLTLLIKTSIVTHINYLHETLTRLYCISEEINGITKNFDHSLKTTSFNPSQLKHQMNKKRKNNSTGTSNASTLTTIGIGIRGYHIECAAGIQNSRPLLAIPLSNSDEIFKNPNA